jgi:hypothetical protein
MMVLHSSCLVVVLVTARLGIISLADPFFDFLSQQQDQTVHQLEKKPKGRLSDAKWTIAKLQENNKKQNTLLQLQSTQLQEKDAEVKLVQQKIRKQNELLLAEIATSKSLEDQVKRLKTELEICQPAVQHDFDANGDNTDEVASKSGSAVDDDAIADDDDSNDGTVQVWMDRSRILDMMNFLTDVIAQSTSSLSYTKSSRRSSSGSGAGHGGFVTLEVNKIANPKKTLAMLIHEKCPDLSVKHAGGRYGYARVRVPLNQECRVRACIDSIAQDKSATGICIKESDLCYQSPRD